MNGTEGLNDKAVYFASILMAFVNSELHLNLCTLLMLLM